MQTNPNTERYMVTLRGSKMALKFHELRVFDCLSDAVEYATSIQDRGLPRVFVVANDKRAKEIVWRTW